MNDYYIAIIFIVLFYIMLSIVTISVIMNDDGKQYWHLQA